MEFLSGIIFTAFILFIGVKIKKVKIEFGDFKEPRTTGGTSGGSKNPPKDTQLK